MIVLELFLTILAPAAEVVGSLLIVFAELLFWLALTVIEIFNALFDRRKVKMPPKPKFIVAHSELESFAKKAREKRAAKKKNS